MNLIGRGLRFFVTGAVDIFYRRRIVDGAIPLTGPVLLVANHPNALLDPAIVQGSTPRRVRMLAKAPLFEMPGISVVVRGLDCLPVYRSKDGADTSANAATFAAVRDALVAGDCVLIFPEGISHSEPSVQPLKTGAARMALQAVAAGAKDLVIVPVGLTYADKLRFRSTAAVDVGHPILVADLGADAALEPDAERVVVHRLTEAIAEGLRQETVNLRAWEDLPLLEAVDAIWRQRDPERARRLKSLADGVELLRRERPDDLDAFRARMSLWLDRMTAVGLTPRDFGEVHLEAVRAPTRVLAFVAEQALKAVLGLPLAVVGAVFWAVPFWAVHLLFLIMKPEHDVGATVKVLAGMVFFPLWWLAMVVTAALTVGPVAAVIVGVVTPGAGLTSRHFFRRRGFALRQVLSVFRLWSRGRVGLQLRAERDALCTTLDDLGAWVEQRRRREGDGVVG